MKKMRARLAAKDAIAATDARRRPVRTVSSIAPRSMAFRKASSLAPVPVSSMV